MTGRLGDRLAAARRRAFVGRTAELRLVAAMLDRSDPATVLHVHGPGGIGKSTLLRQLGWQAEAAGRAVTWLDGREFDPSAVVVGENAVLLLERCCVQW